MRRHHPVRSFFLAAIAALGAACASKPPETDASPTVMRPLERMAGQQIIVLPVQYLASTDTLGWQQQIPNRAAFLAALDDQIEAAMTARGLKSWTFGREVERASKLNSILITDARSLSAEWLRGRTLPETAVRDPLAQQVRGLVGLKGSRYALLPVELRLQNRGPGTGVAILRVVMIDSRMALIKWVGEVESDPMKTFSPALATNVAAHFADLVLAP
ncbi:MAG TPA: hypothetical protein VGO75_16090 [Gemmatimonadaceae bacterium]|jgi:hypothetical protein|nr:hypothetical protein [Gemmatimonadaceae bacterium]